MLKTIYGRAFNVLMKKPLKLWGISLLATVLVPLLTALCGFAIPIFGIAISLLITSSMTIVYLRGYRGEEVDVLQVFECFKDMETIKRVVLGLLWMNLWIIIWGLIPIVGPIFAMIRTYEYRLTVYILITEPEVKLTDAIKISAQRTYGYKLQMFFADFAYMLIYGVALFILGLLSGIPFIGVLFGLVTLLVSVVYAVLAPLFGGLVQAAFYEEISSHKAFCKNCGQRLTPGAVFCTYCGKPTNE